MVEPNPTGRIDPAAAPRGPVAYPCSPEQARFWYEECIAPGNPARNVFARWRLEGDVSHADLQKAWRTLVARHETLRTAISESDGVPVQIVLPRVDFQVREIDLTLLSDAESAMEAERIAALEAQTPFALECAPLVRATHVRRRQGISIVMMTAHHTVCDGWSVGILAREMGEICAALHEGRPANLEALPATYKEYSSRRRESAAECPSPDERRRLQAALAGYTQFELTPDSPRPPVQTWRGEIASVLIERDVSARLAAFARERGCTLFTAAYTALLILLHRHSGATDIALGTQVAGRDDVELEPLVGTFVNTIVLRTKLDGDPAVSELLERARDTLLDAFDLRHVPIEAIVELVNPKRDRSRNPLLSVNFVFQRSFVSNATYGSFSLVDLPSRSAGATYDLCFFMVERPEGWRVSCEYNVDLFAAATAEKLVQRFAGLLRDVALHPERPLSALPLLDADDRAQLEALNRTASAYPSERSLPDLFREQAARTPRASALTCGAASWTYRELDEASNRLARELRERGLGPGRLAGIFLERSPELVIATLGVLKAGAAYRTLEPGIDEAPDDDDTSTALWITSVPLAHELGAGGVALLLLDADAASIEARSPAPLEDVPGADGFALAARRGAGEAVRIAHRSVVNVVWALRRRLALRSRDSVLALSPLSSDSSALDIFLPLLGGAELVLAEARDLRDGADLERLLNRSAATVMQADAATWQRLLDSGWPGSRGLKALCSEPLPAPLADRLVQSAGEVWRLFGSPETTICSFAHPLATGADDTVIGAPLDNTRAYVLDRSGNPVPPGAPGELWIGGDGVALGPLRESGATDERFAADAFAAHAGARTYRTGRTVRVRPSGTLQVLDSNATATAPEAPRQPVAQSALPAAPAVTAAPPLTATEWELRGSVAALLGHDGFDCSDDIFSFGFHSLLALRLIARVKQFYGVNLSLRAVVENPTVTSMAAQIDALRATMPDVQAVEPIVALNPQGTRTPLFFLHSDLFAEGLYCHRLAAALGADQPIYSVAPHGTAGLALLRSVEEMAADYLPRVRAVQPEGPYRVGGFCASGLVAYELARLLEAEGQSVERVVLVNASPMPTRAIPALDAIMSWVGLNRRLSPRVRNKICYNLARLHAAFVRGPRSTFDVVFERLGALLGRRNVARVADPQPFEKRAGELRTENSFGHVVAAFTYHPKTYSGNLTLIWGMAQHISPDLPRKDWKGVAKDVRLLPMAGGHVEQLSERVDELARAIKAALD